MTGFLVYVIKKAGIPDAYVFDDEKNAVQTWTKLHSRMDTGEAIGVGLVQIVEGSKLRRIQFVSTNSDLFVKRAIQFERRWCKRNN